MTTPLPSGPQFTGPLVSQGNFKSAQTNLIAYLAGLLGTDGMISTAKAMWGLNNAPYNPRGAWSSSNTYLAGDWVTDSSVAYLCVVPVGPSATHPISDTSHWQVMQGEAAPVLQPNVTAARGSAPNQPVMIISSPDGGIFIRNSSDTTSAEDGGSFCGTIIRTSDYATNGVFVRYRDNLLAYAPEWYGGGQGNVTNDTAAFNAIITAGGIAYLGYKQYLYSGNMNLTQGGIVGLGWNQAISKGSSIQFSNCTTTTRGAIYTTASGALVDKVVMENFAILANSWDNSTGCLGYGIELEAAAVIRNVYVDGFKSDGFVAHQNSGGTSGPYRSYIENLFIAYSGGHGFHIAAGANAMTFVNPQAFHNGATAYGVAPVSAGNFDGFICDSSTLGGAYPAYTVESLSLHGGDCSSNSRYGWNFDTIHNSSDVWPGYAEGNLFGSGYQATTGVNLINSVIHFSQLNGQEAGYNPGAIFSAYKYDSAVYYGNKLVNPQTTGSAFFYNFIGYPIGPDGSPVNQAIKNIVYLGRNTDASSLNYAAQQALPDGSGVPSGYAVTEFSGSGNYAFYFGMSNQFAESTSDNSWVLPSSFRVKTQTGAIANGAASVNWSYGSAAPVSGAHLQGDIVWNTAPSSGGFIGWVCTTSGTPGTWKTWGAIS